MTKKTFCVGINDYLYKSLDLKGCNNEATVWTELLVNHFDFPRSNFKIVTNASEENKNRQIFFSTNL